MLHLPILRQGVPYSSLDVVRVPHYRTREPFVEISQANAGLIRRDLRPERQAAARAAARAIPFDAAGRRCARTAADHFLNDTLPLGDGEQSPEDYVEQLSATTGMPHVLRAPQHAARSHGVLTRDAHGAARADARARSVGCSTPAMASTTGTRSASIPRTDALGVVLPSNSPGVHSLWVPAIASEDAARAEAGQRRAVDAVPHHPGVDQGRLPARGVQLLPEPTTPAADEILRRTGRGMFFGDVTAVGGWEGDPRVELHGPGYSKVLIGDDRARRPGSSISTLIAASIADNGGRSCVNASGVWVRRRTPSGSPRRWPQSWRTSCRARPTTSRRRWRRSRTREWPSASRRRSTAASQTPGARRGHARLPPRRRGWSTFDGATYLLPTVVLVRLARASARQPRVPVPVRRRRGRQPGRDAAHAAADGQDAGGHRADARPRALIEPAARHRRSSIA